jgi:transcription elongation factor GreA
VAFGLIAGWDFGAEYVAGYIVEKSLSVDNHFVFVVILSTFAVPVPAQARHAGARRYDVASRELQFGRPGGSASHYGFAPPPTPVLRQVLCIFVASRPECTPVPMVRAQTSGQHRVMNPQQTAVRPQQRIIPEASLPMTASDLDQLRTELRGLRLYGRGDIAERLRDARQYGDGSNNDELLAVREEQMVIEARIALLEHVIARAVIADPPEGSGIAGIGSTVSLEEVPSGAMKTYRLASAHAIGNRTISAASPMGQALIGSRAGAVVSLELPDGRSRSVRLVSVKRDRARAVPNAY